MSCYHLSPSPTSDRVRSFADELTRGIHEARRFQTPPAPIDTSQFASRDPRYRIGRGDSFDLEFTKSPEFNQTLIVQPDGYASLVQ